MEDDSLPYLAEYSKSNRAACKTCKEKIEKGILRLAVIVKVTFNFFKIQLFESSQFSSLFDSRLNLMAKWRVGTTTTVSSWSKDRKLLEILNTLISYAGRIRKRLKTNLKVPVFFYLFEKFKISPFFSRVGQSWTSSGSQRKRKKGQSCRCWTTSRLQGGICQIWACCMQGLLGKYNKG